MKDFDQSEPNGGMREPEWWKRIRDEINNWYKGKESKEQREEDQQMKREPKAKKPVEDVFFFQNELWEEAEFNQAFIEQHWS